MIKRIGFLFSSGLLKITLLALALAGAGWMTFGTPENLKKAADESSIYESAVDNIIDTAKKDAEAQAGGDLSLDDPAIEQIAKDAFSPELLSANSESIIDGVYAWLQGTSETPQFNIDLTQAKQQLATGAANYAKNRYESLPPCSFQELQAIDTTNIDAFELNCRVPGLASDTVYQGVLDEVQNNAGFLQDTTFTAEDLPKDEQGRTVSENLAAAPDAYRLFKSLPWLLALLSVLFAAGVLLLSEPRRRGLKSIGLTLLGTGVFLIIGTWFISWAFKQISSQQQTDAFQDSLIDVFSSLVSTYNGNLVKFTVAYIVLGSGILLTLWLQNRQQRTAPSGLPTKKK